MIFRAESPLESASGALRGLRRSLNAPVVTLESLPIGPARAAIAQHCEPAAGVTLLVRSLRSGAHAFFTSGPELHELGSPQLALDAALSFAESMGFLFEDDALETRGKDGEAEAARIWHELLGEHREAASEEAEPAAAVGSPGSLGLPQSPGPAGPLAEPPDPARLLTKFRRAANHPLESGLEGAVQAALDASDPSEVEAQLHFRLLSRF